ncbi:MAG: TRM11 family SAM-dependent methyltransferase, partial [Candidatus Methanospirareceae archaeon]
IDVIVTDAPYGRSSLIVSSVMEKLTLESLYKAFLEEMRRVLRKKGRAVLVSNFPPPNTLAEGFEIIEQHEYRVHKSLNRYITVLEKRN